MGMHANRKKRNVLDKKLHSFFFKVQSSFSRVQMNLDLSICDLRKIVATTDFLVHKLFDLRKIFKA